MGIFPRLESAQHQLQYIVSVLYRQGDQFGTFGTSTSPIDCQCMMLRENFLPMKQMTKISTQLYVGLKSIISFEI